MVTSGSLCVRAARTEREHARFGARVATVSRRQRRPRSLGKTRRHAIFAKGIRARSVRPPRPPGASVLRGLKPNSQKKTALAFGVPGGLLTLCDRSSNRGLYLPGAPNVVHAELVGVGRPARRRQAGGCAAGLAGVGAAELVINRPDGILGDSPAEAGLHVRGRWHHQRRGGSPGSVVIIAVPWGRAREPFSPPLRDSAAAGVGVRM
jgi:hypothetical protein